MTKTLWTCRLAVPALALAAALTFALGGLLPRASGAQEGSRTPIRLIVPFPAGSPPDSLARVVAARMAEHLGRPINVDNRTGAGGTIGATAAARSKPDGLTLFLGTAGTHGINSSLYRGLSYDPLKDFVPVAALAASTNVVVARNDLGVRTVQDLVARARQQPGKLTMGSNGIGTTPHLAGVMLNMMAGIETLHVPFNTNLIFELVEGRIDYGITTVSVAIPHIQTGKVRAIAVTSPARVPQLKDVPTIAESGYPGFSVLAWGALFAPAGTPAAFVERLNAAANQALQEPAVVAHLEGLGAVVLGGTPQALQERVENEVARWPDIVKASGAAIN